MKKVFLSVLLILLPVVANAVRVEINGITYNLYSTDRDIAHVTSSNSNYTGDIKIPDAFTYNGARYSVESIEASAFSGCYDITSVSLPNSITFIGAAAFRNCSKLTTINIPDGVTSINDYLFEGCKALSSVLLPINITSIGVGAFLSCSSLTSMIIPQNVKYLNDYAFAGCSSLTSITIPTGISFISYNTFQQCNQELKVKIQVIDLSEFCNNFLMKSLKECINKPILLIDKDEKEINEIIIPDGITSIGDYSFCNCNGLTSVTIPNSVTSVGISSFNGCTSLTSVTIPNSVTSIGTSAFNGCSGLTSVNCQCSPTSVGGDIFANCTNIKEITFDCEKVTSLFSGNTSNAKINLTDKVTAIDYKAFLGCSGLTYISIPNSVTTIGSLAFQDCTGLNSVVIGSGVTSIGSNAFYNTAINKTIWLTNTLPSGYSYLNSTINYVSNDQLPSQKNKVIKYQFLSSYFDIDGVRYVPISPSERTCDAIDCVYDESVENMIISATAVYKGVTMKVKNIQPYFASGNKYIKTLAIDNDCEVAEYAFSHCSKMTSAKLGANISDIGEYAFYGCSALKEIVIPDAVKSIGKYAFFECSGLESAKMGSGVEAINPCAFSQCSSLKELTIGCQVKIINESAFRGCLSLPSVTIPQAVKEIKDNVFAGCTQLKKVIMDDSEEDLKLGSNGGNPIFYSCPLDSVYIGRNISYGISPFQSNTSLRAVKITDKETEISAKEFYGCTNLQRVIIGDGVTTIGDWAFSGCQSLKYFAFGTQVQTIGKEAFSDCSAVIEIISKANTAPVCGDQALDDINKWECKLYVPDGCLATYQAADQWKDFFFSEEGQGTLEEGSEETPGEKKCEAPTIRLKGGKLLFESKTNGVIFHYSITHSDVKNDITNGEVVLTNTYNISAYASKEGYENSDVVNAQIEVKGGGNGDANGDGVVDAADVVKVTNIIMGE